jgi:hypothetical protein
LETWKNSTERNLGKMGYEVVDLVQLALMASFMIVGCGPSVTIGAARFYTPEDRTPYKCFLRLLHLVTEREREKKFFSHCSQELIIEPVTY